MPHALPLPVIAFVDSPLPLPPTTVLITLPPLPLCVCPLRYRFRSSLLPAALFCRVPGFCTRFTRCGCCYSPRFYALHTFTGPPFAVTLVVGSLPLIPVTRGLCPQHYTTRGWVTLFAFPHVYLYTPVCWFPVYLPRYCSRLLRCVAFVLPVLTRRFFAFILLRCRYFTTLYVVVATPFAVLLRPFALYLYTHAVRAYLRCCQFLPLRLPLRCVCCCCFTLPFFYVYHVRCSRYCG